MKRSTACRSTLLGLLRLCGGDDLRDPAPAVTRHLGDERLRGSGGVRGEDRGVKLGAHGLKLRRERALALPELLDRGEHLGDLG
jgi:hypothetical protein